MSTTPRTDAAWRRYNCAELPDPQELVKEMIALETELTAAAQAYDCAMAIHGTVLEDLAAEREKVRVLREKVRAYLEEPSCDGRVRRGELRRELAALVTPALAAPKEGTP